MDAKDVIVQSVLNAAYARLRTPEAISEYLEQQRPIFEDKTLPVQYLRALYKTELSYEVQSKSFVTVLNLLAQRVKDRDIVTLQSLIALKSLFSEKNMTVTSHSLMTFFSGSLGRGHSDAFEDTYDNITSLHPLIENKVSFQHSFLRDFAWLLISIATDNIKGTANYTGPPTVSSALDYPKDWFAAMGPYQALMDHVFFGKTVPTFSVMTSAEIVEAYGIDTSTLDPYQTYQLTPEGELKPY